MKLHFLNIRSTILTTALCFSMLCANISIAQNAGNVDFTDKFFPEAKERLSEIQKKLKEGERLYKIGYIAEAVPLLDEAQEFNPDNVRLNMLLADCYARSSDKSLAIPYWEKALALAKATNGLEMENLRLKISFLLAERLHLQYEFDSAVKYFEYYKSILIVDDPSYQKNLANVEKKLQECYTAKELVSNPVRVFIDNLGEGVNTKYSEYNPVINADGSAIYYTACRPDGVGGEKARGKNGLYNEDIFATFRVNGQWSIPQNIGEPINTKGHDAVLGISSDGNTLYVFIDENGGDIGFSELQGNVWTAKKNMGKAINSSAHESSGSLSSDGKTFYFVSNKESADKTHDIYYSTKDEKGNWTPAVSIGAPVNSPYDELTVFIHPNNTTLYFSSNGHNSMGGYDIFKSEYKNGSWGTPVNMGYPINTVGWDMFFSITASERYGYFSSNREDGYGEQDLYQVTFLGEEKQTVDISEDRLIAYLEKAQNIVAMAKRVKTSIAVTLLKGAVIDAKTQTPLLATIEITDNELGTNVATYTTNSATGRYLVSLPSGKNYGIAVTADGYLFHSENIDIHGEEETEYQEFVKDIALNPIEVGVKIVLRNIFFESGKSTLSKQSVVELERLVNLLSETKKLRVEISGHTDNVGTTHINKRLSEERAKAVMNYLISKKIDAKRLTAVGYGADNPIESNETETGRASNRRTEFKILEN